jgi:hypothetical protein
MMNNSSYVSQNSKSVAMTVLSGAVVAGLGVGVYRVWQQHTSAKKVEEIQKQLEYIEDGGPEDSLTSFQRFILAEARVKFDVPKNTEANWVLVRRYIASTIKEERKTIRGKDLEMHVDVIAPCVFIPSVRRAEIAFAMSYRPYFWQRWFIGKFSREGLPTYRMDTFVRPSS